MLNFSERLDDILTRYLAYFNYRTYSNEMNLQGNEKVLEVGCGGGNLSRVIAKRLSLGELVCIDSSEYWIEKSKKRLRKFRNIEYKLKDITKISLKNSYYDVVVFNWVLHDIKQEERLKTIKLLKDKLKERGKIYVREPTRKRHGMPTKEIKDLMQLAGLKESYSKDNYSLLLRANYSGVFQK